MTYLCNIVLLYDYITVYTYTIMEIYNGYAKIYIYSKALP